MAKILKSSFSFGFELEAVNDCSQFNTREDLFDKFCEILGDEGNMHRDGSLRCGKYGGFTFEYSSPVFQYTPANISKVVSFLNGLNSIGVHTNRSCGFHTHISFKDITKNDVYWFILYLCGTGKIHEFDKLGRTLLFNRTYASPNFLTRIESFLKSGDLKSALNIVATNEKYRSIRIHPQGTLEWRGPRTFLNTPTRKKTKSFFAKLDKMITDFVDSKNTFSFTCSGYNGSIEYSRTDFEKVLNETKGMFDVTFKENVAKRTLASVCNNTPEILEKIPYKGLVKSQDQIMDIFRNSSSVRCYGKYQSKDLLKFVLENEQTIGRFNRYIPFLTSLFDTEFLMNNADMLFTNSKLYDFIKNRLANNAGLTIIPYVAKFIKNGKYKTTIVKLVKTILTDTNTGFALSVMPELLEAGLFEKDYFSAEEIEKIKEGLASQYKRTLDGYSCNEYNSSMMLPLLVKGPFKKFGII